jgi:hypothetical protein
MRSTHHAPGTDNPDALLDAVRKALAREQPGVVVATHRPDTGTEGVAGPIPAHRPEPARDGGGRPNRQPNRTQALRRRGG